MSLDGGLAQLLRERLGLHLAPGAQQRAAWRFLDGRQHQLGFSSAADYVDHLRRQPLEGEEFARLIGVLTNPHTFFFRDTEQFSAMRSLLLRWRRESQKPLFIWSAGCATGEEPYSLAMLAADVGVEVHVLASDINRHALERAQEASYHRWSMRHLPLGFRERFFTHQGERFRVSPAIRALVQFRFHNLAAGWLPQLEGNPIAWDWILCRNVFIYLARQSKREILGRFKHALASHGWLIMASTESLAGMESPFALQQLGRSFGYRLAPEHGGQERPGEVMWEQSPSGGLARRLTPPPRTLQEIIDEWGPTASAGTVAALTGEARPAPVSDAVDAAASAQQSESLYEEAVALIDRGQQAQAQQRLEELVQLDPGYAVGFVTLGNLHLRAHAFEQALEAYDRAQRVAPLLPEVHYLKGVVYRKLGDLERAREALRQVLFLRPDHWCASFLLAGVHGRLGQEAQQQVQLAHTLRVLQGGPPQDLFSSHVAQMQDATLDQEQVQQLCLRQVERG